MVPRWEVARRLARYLYDRGGREKVLPIPGSFSTRVHHYLFADGQSQIGAMGPPGQGLSGLLEALESHIEFSRGDSNSIVPNADLCN